MSAIKLAYVGANVTDLSRWKKYANEILGFEVSTDSSDKLLYLRADERHHRLSIHPSNVDDIAYVGWELAHRPALETAASLLERNGVKVEAGKPNELSDRRVLDLAHFTCPFTGVRMELTLGNETVFNPPFQSTRKMSGLVTGDLGMGHVVLFATDIHSAADFYVKTLGFGISDYAVTPDGHTLGAFLHCNPRHHSLAFFGVPMGPRGKRVQHIMFETNSIDDVGESYDLCQARKITATSLGRHPNDRALSFYFRNPSNWLFEFGWQLRTVNPQAWTPEQYVIKPGNAWGQAGLWQLEQTLAAGCPSET